MEITHEHGGRTRSGTGDGIILLANKHGDQYGTPCPSAYNGLVTYHDGFHKTLDAFTLPGTPVKVVRRLHEAERAYDDGATERFQLSSAALHYHLDGYDGALHVDVDMRPVDQRPVDGREHRVTDEDGAILISYRHPGYESHLAIAGAERWAPRDEWLPRQYPYDARRGEDGTRYVYRAATITVDRSLKLLAAHGATKHEALARLDYARRHEAALESGMEAYTRNFAEERLEANAALASLDGLTANLRGKRGILAGYPWFTRYWSRDELISTGAHLAAGQHETAARVLKRYGALLHGAGYDAHYPSGGRRAADALGWWAVRMHQLLDAQERTGKTLVTNAELADYRERLQRALAELPRDGLLVTNGPGETWMDTIHDGDDRAGARIEIQALTVAAYRLADRLEHLKAAPSTEWRQHAAALRQATRTAFLHGNKLLDGIAGRADPTTRPNVFLARYADPELLDSREWKRVFDDALDQLWLPWGGLATIPRSHPLYHDRYSGADDASYHRGDSWYWVNALAAKQLLAVDKEAYAYHADALTDACVDDLLFHGALGHGSELSSAGEQEWGGCYAQAWSAAMLYELLKD